MRIATLILFVSSAAFAQAPPIPTFLTEAELRRAIHTAPGGGDAAPQTGLYSLRLSPPSESPVIGIRRTAPGKSELHVNATDVWWVVAGTATLVTGGTIEDGTEAAPGEIRGRGIQGGTSRRVQTGDFAVISAGTPHWISKIEGEEFLYVVVKIPKTQSATDR